MTKAKNDNYVFYARSSDALLPIIILIIFIAFVFIGLITSSKSFQDILISLAMMSLGGTGLFFLWNDFFRTKLIFDETELILVNGNNYTLIPYNKMQHIVMQAVDKFYPLIVFTEPIETERNSLLRRLFYHRNTNYINLFQFVDVPHTLTQIHFNEFRQTEFSKVLYQHAPHLFEKEKVS